MQIDLINCGRRYNQDWIFRNFNFSFKSGERYAILGPNGSGKSTLLNVLLNGISPSEGTIQYNHPDPIAEDQIYKYISFTAPYIELIEEFTLAETLTFHFQFKSCHPAIDAAGIIDELKLSRSLDKPLKYFSSGMKQRTKLILAFCSDTPILLLDEPTSNLDTQGIDWYQSLAERFVGDRLFVVASNEQREIEMCPEIVNILDIKPSVLY